MLYGKLIDSLADRLKDDKIAPNSRLLLGSKINEVYKEVAHAHNWEDLKRIGEISTVGNYTTGTVSITNGSRTITQSGTTWDKTFVGRYFQPQGSSNWYRIIAFVSATQLTLETGIIETSQSGNYAIWKRFYYLNSDVRRLWDFGRWINNGIIVDRSNQFVYDNTVDISLTGAPAIVTPYGVNPIESTYNAGTVSLTQDSTTMTGTGTAWFGSVTPGDLVTVSGQDYRVKRIESDTSIILLNAALQTLTGVSYTILSDTSRAVQFYPNSDKPYIIPYSYFKKVYSMVDETQDRPELSEDFDQVILDGAEANRYREKDDPRWQSKFTEYTNRVKDMKIRFGNSDSPRIRQFSPLIPSRSYY